MPFQATKNQGLALCQYQPCLIVILIPEAHLEPDFHPAAGTSSHTLINQIIKVENKNHNIYLACCV